MTQTFYVPLVPRPRRDPDGLLVVDPTVGFSIPDMDPPVRFEPVPGRSHFAIYRTLKRAREIADPYGRVVALEFGRLDDVAARPGLVAELEAAERNMLRWAAEAERIKRAIDADIAFAGGAFLR